jgi:pilus assembly protein Flp/PilA
VKGGRRVVAGAAACGRRFLADEQGATALEYGLIVSGIAIAICTTIFSVGTNIKEVLYEKIAAALAAM